MEVVNQAGGRIDSERGSGNNKDLRTFNGIDGTEKNAVIKALLVEHNVRFNDAATIATGHACAVENMFGRVGFSAGAAVVSMDGTMQFEHVFAARFLMETVDILGDNGAEFPLLLQLGQSAMSAVGLGIEGDHLPAVEVEKVLGMGDEKAMAEHGFGRVAELLAIEAAGAAEVGDAAFG